MKFKREGDEDNTTNYSQIVHKSINAAWRTYKIIKRKSHLMTHFIRCVHRRTKNYKMIYGN